MSSYTIDEVWRRMDKQDQWWTDRFTAIESRAAEDRRSFVPSTVYEERHLALRDRVLDVETWQRRQEELRLEHVDQARQFRQQMLIAVLVCILSTVGAVIAAIVSLSLH